jgi:hypothetical protein
MYRLTLLLTLLFAPLTIAQITIAQTPLIVAQGGDAVTLLLPTTSLKPCPVW